MNTEENVTYFEELAGFTQEVLIDLIVSILENKRVENDRED
jgi:hypothetical protein